MGVLHFRLSAVLSGLKISFFANMLELLTDNSKYYTLEYTDPKAVPVNRKVRI